jgi:asparagine synthase (glutamine-hydrolysing)
LTAAVPEIPEWIRSQPKRGFLFPMQRWMDGEWRDLFDAVSRRSPVPVDTWYRAWCLVMLDRWRDRLERRNA